MAAGAGCRFEVLDGLAESIVVLPPPTPDSILREARAEQNGGLSWLVAAAWQISATGRRAPEDTATPTEVADAAPQQT